MFKLKVTRGTYDKTSLRRVAIIRRRGAIHCVLRSTRIIQGRSRHHKQPNLSSHNRHLRSLRTDQRVSNTRQLVNRCRIQLNSSHTNSNSTLHLTTERVRQVSISRRTNVRSSPFRHHIRILTGTYKIKPTPPPSRKRQLNSSVTSHPSKIR